MGNTPSGPSKEVLSTQPHPDPACTRVHAVYIETMKSLGYPRPISMDGFRSPNFELVADCLQWLIHR